MATYLKVLKALGNVSQRFASASSLSIGKSSCCHCRCTFSTAPTVRSLISGSNKQWQLLSAVCVERLPVVTQEMNEREREMLTLMKQVELEYSHLSDHELRHAEDMKMAERHKKDNFEESEAEAVRLTALEEEDAWEEELRDFKPASRITDADKKNEIRSTDRKLDRRLVLLVKQKLGNDQRWIMPMEVHRVGESMRQTAERALQSSCGAGLSAVFLGNAPVGVYKYKYPSETQQKIGFYGAKIFFYKAQLRGGDVQQSPDITDFAWLCQDELTNYVTLPYHKRIKKFLFEL